jgi:hypothetical protein
MSSPDDQAPSGKRKRQARERSNVGIGVITLLAIALLSATGILLPGALRTPRLRYTLNVPTDEDLSGIARNTPVLFGGLERGRVLSVRDPVPGGDGRFTVEFELDPTPPLTSNMRAEFVRDVVSNTSVINFTPTSDEAGAPVPVAAGSPVDLVNEVSDASLFMTPAAQRSFNRTWVNVERAGAEWPAMIRHGKAELGPLREDFGRLRGEFEATFDGTSTRVKELIARFRAFRQEFEAIRADWDQLKAEASLLDSSLAEGGSVGRIRRAFAVAGQRFELAGIDAERFRTEVEGMGRRWDDLKASSAALRQRWSEITRELSLRSAMADWTVAATELLELSSHLVRTAVGVVFPNRTSESLRRDANDDLSRQLLFGIHEARSAEQALQRLLDGAEALPVAVDQLDRLIESLRRLTELEEALWNQRVGVPSPTNGS